MRDTPPTGIADQNSIFNLWMTPFTVLNSWNPLLAGTSSRNHQSYEGFSTICLEWQDFMARRFKEDSSLLGKIATSKTPDEVWAAYEAFWQKAADDYGKEFATIMKLTAGVTGKTMATTQLAARDGARDALKAGKAA